MAVKRQSPAVRQNEAEAKSVKRESPAVRQKEAEARAVKRDARQKEAEAMAVNASHPLYDKRRLRPWQSNASHRL